MNRDDLKYRVWDTQERRYLSIDSTIFLNCQGRLIRGDIYIEDVHPGRYVIERCTEFTDNYEIPVYEKDRIKIEDPIKGIEQDTEYCVGWIKGCWYALGAHGMQRLSELLENHSVLVLGTIHDKEQHV